MKKKINKSKIRKQKKIMEKISKKEKKEVKETMNKIEKAEKLDIFKIKVNETINIKTKTCKYQIKLIDEKKTLFAICGNDKFFNIPKQARIIGTIVDNTIKLFYIVQNGQLEIAAEDKIIRTDEISTIQIYGGENESHRK